MTDKHSGECIYKEMELSGQYAQMLERLNLQSIGHFLKEGEEILKVNKKTLSERERESDNELRKLLSDRFEKETVEELLEIISCYVAVKEEIQFSLGMKIGARMLQLLIDDVDRDF